MESENLKEIYKLAYALCQAKIGSQSSAALGADSRAMSFSGLCVTASALLLGLASDSICPLAMAVGAFLLAIAATIAGYSARPVEFFFPGADFKNLDSDISEAREIEDVLKQLGLFADKHIAANTIVISKNKEHLNFAYRTAIAGIFASTIPQMVLYFNLS